MDGTKQQKVVFVIVIAVIFLIALIVYISNYMIEQMDRDIPDLGLLTPLPALSKMLNRRI